MAELWGVNCDEPEEFDPEFDESAPLSEFLQGVLSFHFLECDLSRRNGDIPECELKKVAADLRIFLKTLSKHDHGYLGPMWKGMSKIKSDEELVKVTIPLIGYMWD